MTELSPEARALFDAGRRSLQPTEADRARVLAALSGQVGGLDAPKSAGGAGASAAVKGVGWRGLTALAVGLGVAGTAVVGLRQHEPAPAAPIQARASAPLAPPAPPAAPELGVAPAASDAPAAEASAQPAAAKRTGASAQASDRLSEEVAILSQAERDLHAGHYQSALRLLDEHQRKFPHGTLAQERVAARVQALCGLGRVKEAERALGRLSPNSPHEGTAKAACATKGD